MGSELLRRCQPRQPPGTARRLVAHEAALDQGFLPDVISSDLHNPEFEKKVVARVLLLDFGRKDVPDFTIDYPIYFFPA